MKKLSALLIAGIMGAFAAFGFAACAPKPETEQPKGITRVQQLNYTESTAEILNPDQGFYIPVGVRVTDGGVFYASGFITDSTQVYHLRVDISAFSAKGGGTDQPLTDAALEGIDNLLSLLRSRGKNAVVRFAYDKSFSGNANCEPSLELMQSHIKQFCAVLERYPATVTALEAGMIGPWGEMHTSTAATAENISALIKTFLENTSALPVLVRTPKMIYHYLGIPDGAPAGYTVPESAYRLGLFNDGYLGSETDLGTYTNRENDVAFLSGQTAHLPYGGEVVVPESTLHDIKVCLPEMYRLHLSYLNEQWNNAVINKWKKAEVTADCAGASPLYYGKTAFEYIRDHMGYRFVLKNSAFAYTEQYDNLRISLTLENTGFGNLNKQKTAQLLFLDSNGETVSEQTVESFHGTNSVEYSVPLNLQNGTYRVYLRLSGDSRSETPLYCVRFANDGLFHDALRANLIGEIEIAK